MILRPSPLGPLEPQVPGPWSLVPGVALEELLAQQIITYTYVPGPVCCLGYSNYKSIK